MEDLIKEFETQMHLEGKSDKTIRTYSVSMREYFQWFIDSFGEVEYKKLYRENILEYKNYLKNIKRSKCTFRINGAPFPRQRCKRLAPAVRYPFVVTC